jgi:hypothetical protein
MSVFPASPGQRSEGFGKFTWLDAVALTLILLYVFYVAVKAILWKTLPAEDSLMLMRYANHLAAGQGITWNIGEHPVEGATDFLFLVVLAGCIKISHFGTIFTTRLLLLVCHLLGVGCMYLGARRLFSVHRAVAAGLALYFGTGPGLVHCSNGFSGPFYALMTLAAWYFALEIVTRGSTLGRSVGFAMFALLTGLTRPDGVFLALFMAAALLYALGGKARQVLLVTVAVFAALGGAYFLWRFHYFGHLLPNPFYKKGGGHFYPESLKRASSNVFKMLLPLWPLYALGLLAPLARRRTIFALIPVVAFTGIWVLLTNENNLGMRFQYPVLPIALLGLPLVLGGLIDEARERDWTLPPMSAPAAGVALYTAILMLILCTNMWWKTIYINDAAPHGSGAFRIAEGLRQWKNRNYTILATEAGVIPYFSGWRAIDGWGLNDAEIAHNPLGITDAYMDQNHPAIIMFYLQPFDGDMVQFNRTWRGEEPAKRNSANLLGEMSHYAVTHDYELAARWGASPCNVNVWYVKRGLPETQQMIDLIRHQPYFEPYDAPVLDDNHLGNDEIVCQDRGVTITRAQ